jgi:hypothetical protein
MSRHTLDRGRQIAIAVRDQRRELVDLVRRFRRRLDFNPTADAIEDGFGIEGIGGRRHGIQLSPFRDARQHEPQMCCCTSGISEPDFLWIPGARAPNDGLI